MASVAGDFAAGSGTGGKMERILVSVRVRPLNAKELDRHDMSDWECINTNTIIFKQTLPERSMFPTAYTYDRVFNTDSTTKQVYEEGAKEVALSVVSGINSSIFAYGQTSSGKTYTMAGITEYSVSDIYDYIQQHVERDFILKFSAMEIYNEAVRDLLSPDSAPLRLLDDPEKGTTVERLTEETLKDKDHLMELLSFCVAQRQIGETSLNELSSRSHQILRLTIESSAREFFGRGKSSTLAASVNFVDLAGSERASQALSAGTRLKEGCHINRSLLTLGTVIRKLSKGRNGHIPYRDSKLTRILQSSLGGNAKTAIICTMSPARSHIEQSRNTLLFATCAKEVVTNAQVNVVMSDKALVKHLQRELARLESEMKNTMPTSTKNSDSALKEKDAQIKKMEKEMKELMQQRDLAHSRLEDLLRSLGDDQGSRQWEELSQSSVPRAPSYDDTLSVSEASGVAYQNIEFGNLKYCSSPETNYSTEPRPVHLDNSKERHTISHLNYSCGSPDFSGQEFSNFTDDFKEQCIKEVQCINMVEPSLSIIEDHLLTEDDSLIPPSPPSIDAQVAVELEPKPEQGEILSLEPSPEEEKMLPLEPSPEEEKVLPLEPSPEEEKVLSLEPSPEELKALSFEPSPEEEKASSLEPSPEEEKASSLEPSPEEEKASSLEPPPEVEVLLSEPSSEEKVSSVKTSRSTSPLPVPRIPSSSREQALARSRSCRARMTATPSPWFQEEEESIDTPPNNYLAHFPGRPEGIKKRHYSINYVVDLEKRLEDDKLERISCDGSTSDTFEQSTPDVVIKPQNFKTSADEEDIPCVTNDTEGLKEIAQVQYQKHCNQEVENVTNYDCEVKHEDDNTDKEVMTENYTNYDSGVKITVKDVCIEPVLKSSESPSRWPLEFEKKQREIVELWHACNVSLIHRSYFFLLIKGDPTDSFYIEVEYRRLSFLRNSFSEGHLYNAEDSPGGTFTSSLKCIRREREKLCRGLNRLSTSERENLYKKWGIPLDSKQRRLQLSRKVWTETKDMDYVRESAMLVAKVFRFLETLQAPKEMFGLSFTPQLTSRKSFGFR